MAASTDTLQSTPILSRAPTLTPITPNSAIFSSSINIHESPMMELDTAALTTAKSTKCWSCVQDHRKVCTKSSTRVYECFVYLNIFINFIFLFTQCGPSSSNPEVCEYCSKSGYECREDGVGQSKRRVLASMKCSQCREAKQKVCRSSFAHENVFNIYD